LSYTWADESGDSTRHCPIFLGPYRDVVYVTRGCDQAIRGLRSRQVDRFVWVDSICIKLENIDERNHQVCLLHEIYTNASKVVAYLGEASADSGMAIEVWIDIAMQNRYISD
jgi:hypothetical protein